MLSIVLVLQFEHLEKEKKTREASAATDSTAQKSAYVLEIDDDTLEPWCENSSTTPPSVERYHIGHHIFYMLHNLRVIY